MSYRDEAPEEPVEPELPEPTFRYRDTIRAGFSEFLESDLYDGICHTAFVAVVLLAFLVASCWALLTATLVIGLCMWKTPAPEFYMLYVPSTLITAFSALYYLHWTGKSKLKGGL